jgi:hypothetical protein
MNEQVFSILLLSVGLIAAVFHTFITIVCFAAVSRYLDKGKANTNALRFSHLLGYTSATLVSGGILIGVILLLVNWTNNFPDWASSKKWFWVGFIAGHVILRLIGNWGKRRQ